MHSDNEEQRQPFRLQPVYKFRQEIETNLLCSVQGSYPVVRTNTPQLNCCSQGNSHRYGQNNKGVLLAGTSKVTRSIFRIWWQRGVFCLYGDYSYPITKCMFSCLLLPVFVLCPVRKPVQIEPSKTPALWVTAQSSYNSVVLSLNKLTVQNFYRRELFILGSASLQTSGRGLN